jgi:hypothetical protein
MEVHFKALGRDLWRIVMEGYVILDPKNKSNDDDKNEKLNDRALSVLYNALALSEFNRVKGLEKANEIWEKLMEIYEGTSTVKEAKLYVHKGKFNEFTMKKDEDVSTMFNWLNDIVNELRCLDFNVTNKDFSHKFLRCLPEKYETIVILLVRTNLNKMTLTEVLGEVQPHDLFKQSQKEVQGQSMSAEKKNIALKAKATQEENDDENQEINSDEEMTLIVNGLKRIMKKKKFGKTGRSSKKNPFEGKDCFNCGEIGHISINCPNKKEDKYGKKKDKKSVPKRKKYYKKEKNGQAYFVEWDSDASSDEDGDDKPSRGLVGVAIKEAPSLFSKPYCLMAKGESKVIIDEDDDDYDSDNDDTALSYNDLVAMVIKSDDKLRMERSKLRALEVKNVSLQNSFEELKTTHENLKISQETLNTSWGTLKEKHEELKEAHNSLLAQEVK